MDAVGFLTENGLLFHYNRTVLNPLGLNLMVKNGELIMEDSRDFPNYQIPTEEFKEGCDRLERYLDTMGYKTMRLRKKLLGYVTQKV